MQKSAALPAPATPAVSLQSVTSYVMWTLLAAGLGELFLFRALSRVGVHIPKQGLVLAVYDALVNVGSFAFDVSSVAVFLAVGLLAFFVMRRAAAGQWLPGALAPAIAAFAAMSLLLVFYDESYAIKFVYGVMSMGIMLGLAAQAWSDRRQEPLRALVVSLIVLAYAGAQYHVLANHAYRALGLAAAPPLSSTFLEAAELLVLVNAFAVFWAWSGVRGGLRWRPSWLQLLTAGLLAAVFVGSYRGEDSSTTAILSLWTLGLTLYLPLPLYGLALGLYGAALVACLAGARRDPARSWDAIALGLLPVAGLTLELTYQHLVALVALMLLVGLRPGPEQEPPLASRVPRTEP